MTMTRKNPSTIARMKLPMLAKAAAARRARTTPMTATKQIPVEQVQPGALVWQYGYRWMVKRNVYDPRGNTGSDPRHVLVCDVAQTGTTLGGYARNMTLGHSVGALVTVESK